MDCPIVKGNHDEQASLVESSRDFNEMAEAAIQWTRDNLGDADKEWLRALKLQQQVRDFTIVHATLDTPEQVAEFIVPMCAPDWTETGKFYDYKSRTLMSFRGPA